MKIEDLAVWYEKPELDNFLFFEEKAKYEFQDAGLISLSPELQSSILKDMWQQIVLVADIQSKYSDNYKVSALLRFTYKNKCYGLIFSSVDGAMYVCETARFVKKPHSSKFFDCLLLSHHNSKVREEYLNPK